MTDFGIIAGPAIVPDEPPTVLGTAIRRLKLELTDCTDIQQIGASAYIYVSTYAWDLPGEIADQARKMATRILSGKYDDEATDDSSE